MLWRDSYAPRVLEGVAVPQSPVVRLDGHSLALEGKAIIGAFSLKATSELGIWRRLFESAEWPSVTLLVSEKEDPRLLRAVTETFPKSIHESVAITTDSNGEWRDLVEPDRPERAFALVGDRLIIGAPTEDVWGELLNLRASCE